jgi:ribosomal protein S18 acetylase RimI-like enzyme
LKFEARRDLGEFREYLKRSGYDADIDYYQKLVIKDPARLIVWKENDKIVGHAVWHESNCQEHSKGSPRDKEDAEALRKLLCKKKDFVELHEWWLIKNCRGKGYGNQFLDFFEAYMKSEGYTDLVFYGDHPAALAAFRRHGYREGGYLEGPKEYIFYHSLEQRP